MTEIFTIIAPVFLIMMLGYGLGKTRLFPEGASGVLITFVWYVAIPALLFRSLAPKELPHAGELLFVLAYYSSLYVIYALAMLLSRSLFKLTAAEQGTFAFVTCFGNAGFIGIPIVEGVYGEEGVRLLLMLVSFHSLTLLPITTVIVERAANRQEGPGILARTFASVRHNPILIALMVGLTWSALSLPFPHWLDKVVELPANSAAPVGLFSVGLSLSSVRIAGNITHAMLAVFLKLAMLPLTVFIASHFLFQLPDMWVGVATLMAALPSGMVAYSFASQYGIGARRSATAVLISTGLSALTLSAVLLVLKAGGLS
ncbi:MAG: AEC family transporter [Alphaproteobacteria bacterium]|nr:AEC family transporter [Alphaproteobacteria bacterium]